MEGNKFQIPKLEEDNFFPWSVRVKAALIHKGAWAAIEPGYPTESVLTAAQEGLNAKALAFLMLVVSDHHLNDIGECTRAKEAWHILETMHSSYGLLHQIMMLRELFNLKKSDEISVQDYIGNVQSSYRKISRVGIELPDQTLALIVLMGLPMQKYEGFVRSLEREEEKLSVQSVKSKLLLEEKRLKRNEDVEAREDEVKAMAAVRKNTSGGKKKFWKNNKPKDNVGQESEIHPKPNPEPHRTSGCYTCGALDHFSRTCPEFKEFLIQKATREGTAKSVRSEINDLVDKVKYAYCSVGSKNELKKKQWYLDSCSSDHMTPLKEDFISLEEFNCGIIKMGNGDEAKILGKGTVKVRTPVENGGHIVTLSETLYVPELECALMSVSKLTDKRLDVVFSGENGVVIDGDEVIFRAKKRERVYIVNTAKEDNNAIFEKSSKQTGVSTSGVACRAVSNLNTWHSRFGHLHREALVKVPTLEKFKEGEGLGVCQTCVKGKFSRFSFPKTRSEESTDILAIIHSDLMGKLTPASLGGSAYVVTFTDDYSKFTIARCISSKRDTFPEFLKFQKLVETQHGKKILCFQTDNGAEYCSGEFEDHLAMSGIVHRKTVPGCPSQNGVAERKNRSLKEMTRCLLLESGVPKNFWSEAMMTAVFIRNLCPSSSIEFRIPYELWYNRSLSPEVVNQVKIFGCRAWARKLISGVFDPKAEECVMIGYAENTKDGYRLWSLERKCVTIRRDVVFEEDVFPFKLPILSSVQSKDDDDGDGVFFLFDDSGSACRENEEDILQVEVPAEDANLAQNLEVERNEELEQEAINDPDPVGEELLLLPESPPALRRSNRQPAPKPPCSCCNLAKSAEGNEDEIPSNIEEALNGPNASDWKKAILEELRNLCAQHTWDIIRRQPHFRTIGSKWVFAIKRDSNGHVIKYRARLVAQGFKQVYGINYLDTKSPVVSRKSIRALVYLAVEKEWELDHLDVVAAYLNSPLEEEVYMEIPDGISVDKSAFICKLLKSLYGLKQSGKNWYIFLSNIMIQLNFKKCVSEPCVFYKTNIIVAIYVDDFFVIGMKSEVQNFKSDLGKLVEVKDLGSMSVFLSIQFYRPTVDVIFLNQSRYIESILKEFNMINCKDAPCPLQVGANHEMRGEGDPFDAELYRKAIGCLLYVSECTRPDISNAICRLSQCCSAPTTKNWKGVQHVLRYLKGTINYSLKFTKGAEFKCFCDSDWAGDKLGAKSVTGYVITMGGGAVSWKSRKQRSVATSTVHAEYIALYECACELEWLNSFLCELKLNKLLPANIVVNCDSQGAIAISESDLVSERCKHFVVKYHYVRELVKDEFISPKYVPSIDNTADLLTKPLPGTKVKKFTKEIGIVVKP